MSDKLNVNADSFTVDLVKSEEIMSLVLKCLNSDEFKEYARDRSPEFREGAMWGMAFSSIYANTHATHYSAKLVEENSLNIQDDLLLYHPCNYCGSCSIWLAAYEEGSGLETHEKLIAACKQRGCNLVGTAVPKEILRHD